MASKIKENVFIQAFGRETDVRSIMTKAKDAFVAEGRRASEIKSIDVYLKPEDDAAYYVVNDSFTDRVPLYSN